MASTLSPSGGLILASMMGQIHETEQRPQTQQVPPPQVTPQWGRPDDAERQARLDAMKRRATALLGGALLVFVAASIYEPLYPRPGYGGAPPQAALRRRPAPRVPGTARFPPPLR